MKVIIYIALFYIFALTSHANPSAHEAGADYGQGELMEALPDETREFMREHGITPDNSGALAFTPFTVISGLITAVTDELLRPLRMLAALVGVILLCAAAETLRDSAGGSRASETFRIVGVLAGAGMMIVYVSDVITRAMVTLNAGASFLLVFVPVFAGIMAVCGQLTTASVFSGSLIAAGQVFIWVMSAFLVPLTSCVLGVSAAGAVNPDLKVDSLVRTTSKVVTWTLVLLVTIFTGLLSLQSFISTSADTVTMRAMKFTVSSTVPIVGGAVTDALATVRGSLNLLRGSTGTFGIIAGIAVLAPAMISVLVHKLALSLAAAVADIFDLKPLSALLRSGESVAGMVFAMLFCFMLVLVVSVALMLLIWNGGL